MDNGEVGKLIRMLRTQQNMTQLQLAQRLHITDKAVSKWERGLGSPDVSLLSDLSQIFGVNIEKLLSGNLQTNDDDGGNMKKVKFYICPQCGGVITSTSEAEISCCGRRLAKLEPRMADEAHALSVQIIEDEYYVTCPHDMLREHYIEFIAYVTMDKMLLTRLYPEQNAEIRIPMLRKGNWYYYCTQHGLMTQSGSLDVKGKEK